MTAVRRLEARVHGRVQGVGFRMFVLDAARRLGLAGWVANDPTGAVRVVAEGNADAVQALLVAIHIGPPGAHVRQVDEAWPAPTGTLPAFHIRSGGHAGD